MIDGNYNPPIAEFERAYRACATVTFGDGSGRWASTAAVADAARCAYGRARTWLESRCVRHPSGSDHWQFKPCGSVASAARDTEDGPESGRSGPTSPRPVSTTRAASLADHQPMTGAPHAVWPGRLDGATFSVIVHRLRHPAEARGGPWLVRVFHGDDRVHSAEGGVPLDVGLREAQRAMQTWCEENGA